MKTATLVQASAEIITIVQLKKGDVYKRLTDNAYGADKYQMQIGIVQDVVHNGEDGAITALEFEQDWNSLQPKIRVFGTDADIKIFPAVPEEVEAYFNDLVKTAQTKYEGKRTEMNTAHTTLEQVRRVTQEMRGKLTAPETGLAIEASTPESESSIEDNQDGITDAI